MTNLYLNNVAGEIGVLHAFRPNWNTSSVFDLGAYRVSDFWRVLYFRRCDRRIYGSRTGYRTRHDAANCSPDGAGERRDGERDGDIDGHRHG